MENINKYLEMQMKLLRAKELELEEAKKEEKRQEELGCQSVKQRPPGVR